MKNLYLFESSKNVSGETDSECCVLCKNCCDRWLSGRMNKGDVVTRLPDSQQNCDECGD